MASVAREFDCIIFGGGLAGTLLAWTFIEKGKNPLLVNKRDLSNCSHVAAGLVNPIGGKRMNLVWEASEQIPFATETYQKLGRQFRTNLFFPRTILRLLSDPESREIWSTKSKLEAYSHWIQNDSTGEAIKTPSITDPFFAIQGGGYLDIPHLLKQLHVDLEARGNLKNERFDYSNIEIGPETVSWNSNRAPIAIFAEGWLGNENPWLSFVPFRPAKGVIGKINSNIDLSNTAIVDRFFLIPRNDGSIHVGATYIWDKLDESPDPESVLELETFLQRYLNDQWEWSEIASGIRPSIPGAKPIVGQHPELKQIFVFNGFGSKGATQIPLFAQRLHDHIYSNYALPIESSPQRFWKENSKPSKRWIAFEIARHYVLQNLSFGDIAIDATAGNGHDTLWLAKAVGPQGHVYAFDIQGDAIESTRRNLAKADSSNRVTLINSCHSRIQNFISVKTSANAIVFNLGYLPNGEKSVITQAETTIRALESSLPLLLPGGILSIVAYPGHHGGDAETKSILDWYQNIDCEKFAKRSLTNPSGNPNSPIIFFLERKLPNNQEKSSF